VNRVRAEITGIACAAMVPAVALSVLQIARDTSATPTFGSFLVWAALVYAVVLVITVVVRYSVVSLLDRFGWANAVTSLLAGGLVGALAVQAFVYPASIPFRTMLIYAGIGMLSGLMFWWVRPCFEE
jgi:Na+/H+ antiporter NhaC